MIPPARRNADNSTMDAPLQRTTATGRSDDDSMMTAGRELRMRLQANGQKVMDELREDRLNMRLNHERTNSYRSQHQHNYHRASTSYNSRGGDIMQNHRSSYNSYHHRGGRNSYNHYNSTFEGHGHPPHQHQRRDTPPHQHDEDEGNNFYSPRNIMARTHNNFFCQNNKYNNNAASSSQGTSNNHMVVHNSTRATLPPRYEQGHQHVSQQYNNYTNDHYNNDHYTNDNGNNDNGNIMRASQVVLSEPTSMQQGNNMKNSTVQGMINEDTNNFDAHSRTSSGHAAIQQQKMNNLQPVPVVHQPPPGYMNPSPQAWTNYFNSYNGGAQQHQQNNTTVDYHNYNHLHNAVEGNKAASCIPPAYNTTSFARGGPPLNKMVPDSSGSIPGAARGAGPPLIPDFLRSSNGTVTTRDHTTHDNNMSSFIIDRVVNNTSEEVEIINHDDSGEEQNNSLHVEQNRTTEDDHLNLSNHEYNMISEDVINNDENDDVELSGCSFWDDEDEKKKNVDPALLENMSPINNDVTPDPFRNNSNDTANCSFVERDVVVGTSSAVFYEVDGENVMGTAIDENINDNSAVIIPPSPLTCNLDDVVGFAKPQDQLAHPSHTTAHGTSVCYEDHDHESHDDHLFFQQSSQLQSSQFPHPFPQTSHDHAYHHDINYRSCTSNNHEEDHQLVFSPTIMPRGAPPPVFFGASPRNNHVRKGLDDGRNSDERCPPLSTGGKQAITLPLQQEDYHINFYNSLSPCSSERGTPVVGFVSQLQRIEQVEQARRFRHVVEAATPPVARGDGLWQGYQLTLFGHQQNYNLPPGGQDEHPVFFF